MHQWLRDVNCVTSERKRRHAKVDRRWTVLQPSAKKGRTTGGGKRDPPTPCLPAGLGNVGVSRFDRHAGSIRRAANPFLGVRG